MNKYIKNGLIVGMVAVAVGVPTNHCLALNKEKNLLNAVVEQQRKDHKLQLQEHEKESKELLKQINTQLHKIDSLNKNNKELKAKNTDLEGVRCLISNNLNGYQLQAGDIRLLQMLVEAEAGDEPFEGKIAVVNVIMNRMKDPTFPHTIRGIIYQKNQFEPVVTGVIYRVHPSASTKEAVERALKGEKVIPNDIVNFWAVWLNKDHMVWKHLHPVMTIGTHHFARGWDK